MDELDKNIPDDFWRKAFDEASEAPPPQVWNAIERRLDESNGPRVLPLWSVGLFTARPLAWGVGMAAALALLLVGWWSVNKQSVSRPVAHSQQPVEQPQEPSQARTTYDHSPSLSLKRQDKPEPEAFASTEKVNTRSPQTHKTQQNEQTSPTLAASSPERSVALLENRLDKRHKVNIEVLEKQHTELSDLPKINVFAPADKQPVSVGYTSVVQATIVRSTERSEPSMTRFEKLALRPMKFRSPGAIHRIVWFRPAELPMEPQVSKSSHKAREVWASVGMMPGAFNPSVSLRSAQTAAFSNAATSSQPVVNSRANFSVAYQAGAGVQLTDRWSVESGIGYLSAHSSVESPGQYSSSSTASLVTTNRNSASGNLYANAVRSSISSTDALATVPKGMYYDALASSNTVQAYDVHNQQNVVNNYEYVQVPVQIGYQLRPRKRLSMALLGGLLTNIFVRNTIGDDLVVTGKDGVYRPLSLAATMGARFRYRPSHRWSASVAGMYQPSLGFSTRPESQVQSSPTSAGMSFGLDYHF